MFKGFYTLGSGMLTQERNLNVIGNNMTNMLTPGFKRDRMIGSTFQEEMMYRTGNKNKADPTDLGTTVSNILTPVDVYTDFKQGPLEETQSPLDFALISPGFFQVQREDGSIVYTRNGNFDIDNEGYMILTEVGRVLGENGPIFLGTDRIYADDIGTIYRNGNQFVDTLAIVDFDDYTQLNKMGTGIFQTEAQANDVQAAFAWKYLESSNVEPIEEMSEMIMSQRALQSASQVIKMYDQLMAKATTELGKI